MADKHSVPLPGPSKHRQGKAINLTEQQMVVNVLGYFQKEHENGGKPFHKANAVVLKTSQATGVSMNSLQRIVERKDEPLMTPGKNHPSRKPRFGKLDSVDFGVTRRIIHQFYLRNEIPSLEKILKELRQKNGFSI